ncbi:MAG: outer membrane lipid asymmetry maintenance protein MlaD [Verrucomicrobiota bacterium]
MKKHWTEIVAGLFVLAGLAVLLYLAVQVGGVRVDLAKSISLTARFTDASGVKAGTPVRIAGVTVGEVSAVRLDREQFVAMVNFEVPADLELFDDTIAAVQTSGLIGDRFIALKPGGSGIALEDGDVLYDTEGAINIESLIKRFAFGNGESGGKGKGEGEGE